MGAARRAPGAAANQAGIGSGGPQDAAGLGGQVPEAVGGAGRAGEGQGEGSEVQAAEEDSAHR